MLVVALVLQAFLLISALNWDYLQVLDAVPQLLPKVSTKLSGIAKQLGKINKGLAHFFPCDHPLWLFGSLLLSHSLRPSYLLKFMEFLGNQEKVIKGHAHLSSLHATMAL